MTTISINNVSVFKETSGAYRVPFLTPKTQGKKEPFYKYCKNRAEMEEFIESNPYIMGDDGSMFVLAND